MHGLTLLGLLLLVIVVKMASSDLAQVAPFWLLLSGVVFLILFVAVGLLPIIVGYGLSKRKSWVKSATLFLAVISLVNIPIGTALGIYAIKFLRSEGGAKIYGGTAAATRDEELETALEGARPLMNLANRLK
jgi:hypothetical protein